MAAPSRVLASRYGLPFGLVRAYKFLDAEGRGPFTGAPWRPGEWVERADAVACHDGVHGVRAADLSHWLAASLWEVELDGKVVESHHKVVGSRGRLVQRVDAYADAVRELAEVGAWRCRDRAVDALGDDPAAAGFRAAPTLEDLAALGATVDDSSWAGAAAALAADAAHFALHGLPSQSPFVAACSAGHAAAGPAGEQAAYEAGYAAERDFQSAWLAERLGLT
jgi:hypothetical protein